MPANPLLEPFEALVQLISAIVVLEMFFYIWKFRNIQRARASAECLFSEYMTFRRGLLFVFIGVALHLSGSLFIPISPQVSVILYALAFSFIFGGLLAHLLILYYKKPQTRVRKAQR
ncbi:MAG: hypothetical protein QXG98_02545 [Candidatus Micrarchaeia archaeon]